MWYAPGKYGVLLYVLVDLSIENLGWVDEMTSSPICSRKETQYLYFDMIFGKKVYNSVIQRFGNASGANEYAPDCLLKCTKSTDLSCMPKPIMSHQRNRYMVVRHREMDVLCLKQTRVSPHDFVNSGMVENPHGITTKAQCQSLSTGQKHLTTAGEKYHCAFIKLHSVTVSIN